MSRVGEIIPWLDDRFELTPMGLRMAQRCSEYARMDSDTYVTPGWVFNALISTGAVSNYNWFECAPVVRGDYDFLKDETPRGEIVSNPPFKLSEKFVRHALELTKPRQGKVAMLLPHTWDTAKSRTSLFTHWPFKAKYVLTKRIRWTNLVQKEAGPSTNHAWYVWDWGFSGEPKMGWLNGSQSNG